MFLRCHTRLKDGKEHRYYSVEESRRLQSGKAVQRRVLYLGEITAVSRRPGAERWKYSMSSSSGKRR